MSELKTHECWVYDYGCRADMVNKSEADRYINRQKYKRCLAMAKLCGLMSAFHNGEWYARWIERWYERWFELAMKFKEVK